MLHVTYLFTYYVMSHIYSSKLINFQTEKIKSQIFETYFLINVVHTTDLGNLKKALAVKKVWFMARNIKLGRAFTLI